MANYKLISADDKSGWVDALKSCGVYDTYHCPEYHLLAEEQGEGTPFMFFFEDEGYRAALPFLVRRVSYVEGLDDFKLFDVTSVYGYPGIVTNVGSSMTKADVFRSGFQRLLLRVLRAQKVVAFFTRQNPLFQNSWLFQGIGEVRTIGRTVAIDLAQPGREQEKNMTKGHRYDIRKAKESGIIAYEDKEFKHIEMFISMYNETMKRNNARDYYYFPESYYHRLKKSLGQRLKLFVAEKDGMLISASLFLTMDNIIQYHLSGTPNMCLNLSGTKVILDEIRKWGTSKGYRWLHLGGGLGSTEDSLFRFKAGFSKTRFSFEVVNMIIDPLVYRKLVDQRSRWADSHDYENERTSDSFFPAYRTPVDRKE